MGSVFSGDGGDDNDDDSDDGDEGCKRMTSGHKKGRGRARICDRRRRGGERVEIIIACVRRRRGGRSPSRSLPLSLFLSITHR